MMTYKILCKSWVRQVVLICYFFIRERKEIYFKFYRYKFGTDISTELNYKIVAKFYLL